MVAKLLIEDIVIEGLVDLKIRLVNTDVEELSVEYLNPVVILIYVAVVS